MVILVTGIAGFIGAHVAKRLLERGDEVVGVDNLNDYYDPALKRARLSWLEHPQVHVHRLDISDAVVLNALADQYRVDRVVHLAAQAGVRYSLENPHAYVQSNMLGFLNVLEFCRQQNISHLVYASSSSVYGANTRMPFAEKDAVDHPLSLYAASKKSNELMAHAYSHLYALPVTGLRFFTVYGPWGRPDMALFRFTKAILAGDSVPVFNYGQHRRDFTYIDDIVEGVIRVLDRPARGDAHWNSAQPAADTSLAPWRIYNIGNHQPVELLHYIRCIEEATGKKAQLQLLPMQPGDVPDTYADCSALRTEFDYEPQTPVAVGVGRFVHWYRHYYRC